MTKRPLLIAALSFIWGIVLAVFDVKTAYILPVCLCLMLLVFWRKRKMTVFIAFICLFALLGSFRMERAERTRSIAEFKYASRTYDGEILITDFSDNKKVTAEFSDEGKRVRIYLSAKESPDLYPGDIVRGKFTLSGVSRSKSNKSDFGTYLAGKGIYLYAKAEKLSLISQYTKGIRAMVFSVRRYAREVAQNSFSGDVLALFCAMVMGDKSLISEELNIALQGAGINHIAVVSGMHLSIMIALQMFFVQKIFGKRRIGAPIAVLGALFITLVTGAGASVVRALVMCMIYQLSRVVYRENDAISSLSLTVLVMTALNPYVILNAGLILSALSVLGIVLYSEKIQKGCDLLIPSPFSNACSVTISAQLAVFGAVIYYFGIITPYALISNLLIAPFATAIVPVGMAYVLLCNVPVIDAFLAFIIKFFAEATIFISESVCALPGAITPIGNLGIVLFAAWVFMLLAIYLYPKHIKRIGALSAKFAAVFCVIVTMDAATEGRLDMYFLNYGKGSSSIISNGENTLLIGCVDAYDVEEFKENKGIKNFSCAILSDTDYEEMLPLAQSGLIDTLVIPKDIFTREETEKIEQSARESNLHLISLGEKEDIIIGDMIIDYPNLPVKSNDGAAVRIEYDTDIFISLQSYGGRDIEKLLQEGIELECDALKLPFAIFHKETDVDRLTSGKILQKENKFSIKN